MAHAKAWELAKNLATKNELYRAAANNLALALEEAGDVLQLTADPGGTPRTSSQNTRPRPSRRDCRGGEPWQYPGRGRRRTTRHPSPGRCAAPCKAKAPDDLLTLGSMSDLGNAYRDAGRAMDAIMILEQAESRLRRRFGKDNSVSLIAASNLAAAYATAGRLDEAIKLQKDVLKRTTNRFGSNHPRTLIQMSNLAVYYSDAGRFDEAIALKSRRIEASAEYAGSRAESPGHTDYVRQSRIDLAGRRAARRSGRAFSLMWKTAVLRSLVQMPG